MPSTVTPAYPTSTSRSSAACRIARRDFSLRRSSRGSRTEPGPCTEPGPLAAVSPCMPQSLPQICARRTVSSTVSTMITSRQRNIALLVAGCFFMENLDGTIVTTAAPRIGADLHVPSSAVGLVITVYLMTLAVLIPLSGWMTARYGTRKVFLAAIITFTTASALCAASHNLGELVAMRVLQGAGGAMMVPVGRLAVLAKAAKQDIMRLVAYIVWPGLVAPVIAPLAGGLITTYTSWRWLFLINVPLAALALAAAARLIESTLTEGLAALDRVGVVLTCAGLAGFTYTAYLLSEPAVSW